MALERPGTPGLNYDDFKTRLSYENFVANQSSGISMRLGLLESFMHASNASSTPSSERPDFPDTDKGRMKAREWQADQDSIRRALLVSTVVVFHDVAFLKLMHFILGYLMCKTMQSFCL